MTNGSEKGGAEQAADAADRELEEMQRRSDLLHDQIAETRPDFENERGQDATIATNPGSTSEPTTEHEEKEQ